ncbi:CU044_2847 family protein [Nonomuraea angiospora]|uniref:CU044_2847 family protein n=1 Tax=Nonomuraea angiospora TaxID=46172 RepID=UPI0037960ABE
MVFSSGCLILQANLQQVWIAKISRGDVVSSMLLRIPLDGTPDSRFMVAEIDYEDMITEGGIDLVSDDGTGRTVRALRSLAETFDGLEPALSTIVTRLRTATRGPDAITVEFGLKFGGETGVIFTKGKAEAALKVTVTWNGTGEPVAGEGEEAEAEPPDEP